MHLIGGYRTHAGQHWDEETSLGVQLQTPQGIDPPSNVGSFEPLSKLLVSPLISPIVVPYII